MHLYSLTVSTKRDRVKAIQRPHYDTLNSPTKPPTAANLHAQYAALTGAIQSISMAHTNIEKRASLAALSPQAQHLADAFRVAGPERKQIFLNLAEQASRPRRRDVR